VLDSFSTDRTPQICGSYDVQFHQEQWRGFSAQKQRAVGLASNDWVVVLDSDERFTEELAEEVRSLMGRGPDRDGYHCARRNHFGGRLIRHGGWYPDYSVRLFNRTKAGFTERPVHEAVEVRGTTGYLENPMLHYTYNGVSDYLKRMERYSLLAAEEMLQKGRRTSVSDLLFRPPFTFLKMFVLKQGFRDGYYGLLLAVLYSFYTFTKYARLRELAEGGEG